MKNILKASALAATFVLAGCVVGSSNNVQNTHATGDNAGNLVVFATDNLDNETVAIYVNNQFIAPLQSHKQFTQGLCSGGYQLKARSVNPTTRLRKVVREIEQQWIQIEPQTTTYVELSRSVNGWSLKSVEQEEWQAKTGGALTEATDSKIVRRLTPELVKCE